MRSERDRLDPDGLLLYHINLVQLLAYCTEGKNVYTEIKCHSLLPLDDIVKVVTHPDCIPEVCAICATNSLIMTLKHIHVVSDIAQMIAVGFDHSYTVIYSEQRLCLCFCSPRLMLYLLYSYLVSLCQIRHLT